jgi:hypothetical protein
VAVNATIRYAVVDHVHAWLGHARAVRQPTVGGSTQFAFKARTKQRGWANRELESYKNQLSKPENKVEKFFFFRI